jgi:hypothetical protein
MPVVDYRLPSGNVLRSDGPAAGTAFVGYAHPLGTVYARVECEHGTPVRATWDYMGDVATVNGVCYSSLAMAMRVKEALAAAGIPNEYPGSPKARKALRTAGVIRTPQAGEEWGCGVEFGTIERFTAGSRAVIRQTKPGGLVAVGETFELPIHVLSPKYVPDC